jgi:hypothetical protein
VDEPFPAKIFIMKIKISTRFGNQSDDPVRQAVATLPGAISQPLWYNLFATKLTGEGENLSYFLISCALRLKFSGPGQRHSYCFYYSGSS